MFAAALATTAHNSTSAGQQPNSNDGGGNNNPPAYHTPLGFATSAAGAQPAPLGSFAEFEHLIKQQLQRPHQLAGHAAASVAASANQTANNWNSAALTWAQAPELLECHNQLQLREYYQAYDIFVGLRIASSLSLLFIVFILFVIYKTGCHGGERASRSQLRLTSSASAPTTKTARPARAKCKGAGSERAGSLGAPGQLRDLEAASGGWQGPRV